MYLGISTIYIHFLLMFHLLFIGGVTMCVEVRRKLVGVLIHHESWGIGLRSFGLGFGGRCFLLAPELYLYFVSLKSTGDQVHSSSFWP